VLKQINDKELAMFLDSAPAYFEHLARVYRETAGV
jgi:hypothetical protein